MLVLRRCFVVVTQVYHQVVEDALAQRTCCSQRCVICPTHKRRSYMIKHGIVMRDDRERLCAECFEILYFLLKMSFTIFDLYSGDDAIATKLPVRLRTNAPVFAGSFLQGVGAGVEVEIEDAISPHTAIAHERDAFIHFDCLPLGEGGDRSMACSPNIATSAFAARMNGEFANLSRSLINATSILAT